MPTCWVNIRTNITDLVVIDTFITVDSAEEGLEMATNGTSAQAPYSRVPLVEPQGWVGGPEADMDPRRLHQRRRRFSDASIFSAPAAASIAAHPPSSATDTVAIVDTALDDNRNRHLADE
ncbi:unnamed protein product [Clonostachys rosea]|uniref:Uncharacterized protein n=1 Tax=Bionectria ochroleuca TaxID=29856 RepID=A0ABY6UYR3_BIOOC|nr:unnamed protein product [Clonostachys rosea]